MAITQGNTALASDFNSIRTKVINEFNTSTRRNIGSNYQTPAGTQNAGNIMYASNVDAIAKDLYYVNSGTYTSNGISAGTTISISAIDTAVTTYAGKAKVGSASGCKSGCVGLCQGCSGTCTGSCTGSCSGGCSGCKGTCTGSCSGCSGTCTGGCGGCDGSCTGTCKTGCTGGCKGSCKGCSGCGSSCDSSCHTGCYVNEL